MKNVIFEFSNKIDHQIFGAHMTNRLFPIIAEVLVQYIFKTAIKICRNPLKNCEIVCRLVFNYKKASLPMFFHSYK